MAGLRAVSEVAAESANATDALAADVRESKIVELSRKNRGLNLALQRERARASKLEQELRATRQQSEGQSTSQEETSGDAARELVAEAAEAAETAEAKAAEWREKAQSAKAKAEKADSRVSTLKAENDRLRQALKRELGDEQQVERALTEGSDWRGRAEQISLLKDKVREFREQLGESKESSAKANVRRAESKRKEELEKAEQEAEKKREEVEALTKRLDAANARKKNLEREVSSLKEKISALLRKSQNDDKLIDRLRAAQGNADPSSHENSEPSQLSHYAAELEEQNARQERIIASLEAQLDSASCRR